MSRLIRIQKGDKENIFLVLDDGEQRSIGYLKDGKLFIKRDRKIHYFNIFHGYGYNLKLLDSLPGNTRLVLQEKGNPRLCYTTTVSDIIEYNKVYKAEGYEPQYILPFEYMKIDLRSIQK